MGREDQIEEREVLDSIFPDEITGKQYSSQLILSFYPCSHEMHLDISETSYRVSITLDALEYDGDEREQPVICLEVSYPEDYPDVGPNLGISSPPNAVKHPRLDVQEDRDLLMESLQLTIEENLGMPMIFTLVSALKESAELLMTERANAIQAEIEEAAAKREEEENRKFQGTAVTVQSFLEWSAKF